MPVYNSQESISTAIESVISQTYKNWELICINDASTDNTKSILQYYQTIEKRIRVYNNRGQRGVGYSLNKGITQAKGQFIARMDGDDISLENRLAQQVGLLIKNPRLVACGGNMEIMDERNNTIGYQTYPSDNDQLYKMIMKVSPLSHPTLMARVKIMKKYKYKTNLSTAEDVDMFFYLLSQGPISNVQDFIYKYSWHLLDVKKTFYITFLTRFIAIIKYGYIPTFSGILTSILQLIVISLMPEKIIIKIFETVRFYRPLRTKENIVFPTINTVIAAIGKRPI